MFPGRFQNFLERTSKRFQRRVKEKDYSMNKSANRSTTAKPSKAQDSESRTASTALHELFLDELADVYNAEKQLLKALPKMAKAANSDELRQAFESHLKETEGQVSRIEELAQKMDE